MCENCNKQNTTFDGANISEFDGNPVVQNILIYDVPGRGPGNAYPVTSRTPASFSANTLDDKAEARTLLGLAVERMLFANMNPTAELEAALNALENFVIKKMLEEMFGDTVPPAFKM